MPAGLSKRLTRVLLVAVLGMSAPLVGQTLYVDAQGREWRQLSDTTLLTWNAVAAVCPTDGITPAAGSVGGANVSGWVWATRSQVTEMLSDFAPALGLSPSVGGPGYVLTGLSFFGAFTPTWQFYTTTGGYLSISGWTASTIGTQAYVAAVSAQYPVFNGAFDTTALVDTATSNQYRGIWMYRQLPSSFQNLGYSLPGTNGFPGMTATSTLAPGSPTTITISHGPAQGSAFLAVGFTALNLPVAGGTLVPNLDIVFADLPLDPNSALTLSGSWPVDLQPGTSVYLQAWFVDAGAPSGLCSTNALVAINP